MSQENKPSFEPVFVIGLTLVGIRLFWFVVTKLLRDWYTSGFFPMISIASTLVVPILCIYYVKDQKQRSILIGATFLLVLLSMAERLML